MKTEADIVAELKKWIEARKGLVLKTHGSQFSVIGTPDLIGSIPVYDSIRNLIWFVHFAVEVKQPGKQATEIQLHRLNQWSNQNFATGVVASVEKFKELILEYSKTGSVSKMIALNVDTHGMLEW